MAMMEPVEGESHLDDSAMDLDQSLPPPRYKFAGVPSHRVPSHGVPSRAIGVQAMGFQAMGSQAIGVRAIVPWGEPKYMPAM